MGLRVAIQMDPIASIKPGTDSTLLLGLEAQKRGHHLFYYTPDKLTYRDGAITASAQPITLHADPAHYFDLGETQRLDLKTTDVVLLRQDPPFDMSYVTTTYLLEMLHPRPLVVNHPASVRNHPEKIFPSSFREFMPPTLITADIKEIEHFRREHKDIVIKPLYSYSGYGVFRLKPEDTNFNTLVEMLFSKSHEPWTVQRFLPEVDTGYRRIILVDGKVTGSIAIIPPAHEIRATLRVGATVEKATLTPRQRELCDALAPVLKEKSLIFTALDVIGDYLTEINITSPGLSAMTHLYGKSISAEIWDAIEARLQSPLPPGEG